MQITFFVGNGFDMRMGIKSSYDDFKANYCALPKSEGTIKKFQKSLIDDGALWSNFEKGLGQYTDKQANQNEFVDCINDFTVELIKYLTKEETKIDISLCSPEIKKEMLRSFQGYDKNFDTKYRNQLRDIISNGGDLTIRTVSFNYTHILDNCLKEAFEKDIVIGNHVWRSTRYQHKVSPETIHVHGALPGPIITGVDNIEQIANKAWAKQKRFQELLIKPSINDRRGSLVDAEARKEIDNSNIICLFGMSIGETDKKWWSYIGGWLRDSGHRLIVYDYKEVLSTEELTLQTRFLRENETKDKFMSSAGINENEKATIEDRIYVCINPTIFNIDLVSLTASKRGKKKT